MQAFEDVIGKYIMVGAGQFMRDYRRAHRYIGVHSLHMLWFKFICPFKSNQFEFYFLLSIMYYFSMKQKELKTKLV